jgi:3',5'-cyclic AMP phosphodiesterase CpdA
MHYTLMQLSDLHAGPPFDPQLARLVAQQAHELRPDLLIVSGDLVQRAVFPRQWQTISRFLEELPQPRLVVPGNHDVPLLDPFARAFAPLRYYQRHIAAELTSRFTLPGLTVVGACSAHGWTIDGGYVFPRQLAALDAALAQAAPDDCKVVVLHHPLVDPPSRRHKAKILNTSAVRRVLERHSVELYLSGHVHISMIQTLPVAANAASRDNIAYDMVLSQCGTTTSRRGRGSDHARNSFHLITIDDRTLQVAPYFYVPAEQRFMPAADRVRHFTRRGQAQAATAHAAATDLPTAD